MIANSCIKIKTNKFPILEGEDDEICNENMYGKALCLYLEKKLPEVGIKTKFFCNEDWGWWFEVEHGGFSMALCIYSPDFDSNDNPNGYVLMPSIHTDKRWSWSKLKKVNVSNDVLAIMNKITDIFKIDNEIINVSRHDDWPY